MPHTSIDLRQHLAFLLAILLGCAFAFIGWDLRNLDNVISSHWGNAQGFTLRDDPFWGTRMHQIERLMSWSCLAVLAWMVFKPPISMPIFSQMPKYQRGFMLAGVIVALLVIQLLKRLSLTSCPWDYQLFGGVAQDISHWRFGVKDGGPGHCFPAGHPSGGFAFLAVPAFVMLASPRQARVLLALVLLFGGLLGFTQVARGAHFVSHVLWSAWWCGAMACLSVALAWAWQRRIEPDSGR